MKNDNKTIALGSSEGLFTELTPGEETSLTGGRSVKAVAISDGRPAGAFVTSGGGKIKSFTFGNGRIVWG